MGMQEDALEAETAAVREMRASEIKKNLEELSIATKGVYEVGLSEPQLLMMTCDTYYSVYMCNMYVHTRNAHH